MSAPMTVYATSASRVGCASDGTAKTGAVPDERRAHAGGDRGRQRDGNERARAVLEQQQLDGEKHRGDGTAERRRHAGGGAGGEQRLPLVGRDANELPDERAERAAGRDDRSLGAERPAGADRDRRRERLEEHDARRDAAARVQHPLHHLGNAVAADRRRAVARHQPDDERADERDEDRPGAEPNGARRGRTPSRRGRRTRRW